MKIKVVFFHLFTLVTFFSYAQPKGNEELYQTRLASLKSTVDFTYRPEVKQYIDAYLDNPEKTREIIGLSKVYFPMIEKALRSKGVTTDMKYLAVAVSQLDPMLQSPSGATGIWMMMYNVSKMYKIKINSFVDERRDPSKSSNAAASHFRDLYSIYKQWPLVIAAYGCSPIMLNKSIRMAGNSIYFWDLYNYIPGPSRDLYPRFIAAAYILNFYREHGIKPVYPELYVETDSVLVNKWLSFQQISATIDIPLEQLRNLNPCFKKDIIPYNVDGYLIYLPRNKGYQFDMLKDSVYNPLPRPTDFAPVLIRQAAVDSVVVPLSETQKTPEQEDKGDKKTFDKKRISYTVKRGETLPYVADLFDVEVREIRSWSKLRTEKLKLGQKLTIWVKASKSGYYKRINTMTTGQKKKLRSKD